MKKGEARLLKIFVIFSIGLFVYLIFDLCVSYIYVYDMALGEAKSVPVLSLIPMIKL